MSMTPPIFSLRQQTQFSWPASCNGFTLIEVLVAVLVLSLGVLGVASLQIVSTRSNFEGLQRSQATLLAQDALDRMRANPEQLDVYASTVLGGGTLTTEPLLDGDRALRDRWELEQMADKSDALVTPRICITNNFNGAGSGNVRIVVAWRGVSRWEDLNAAPVDPCGQADIDADYRKQVVISTFIDPTNWL